MRIGIVCYPTVGGSGVVATELGHALVARGHEIHFIAYDIPFRLQIENPKIHFHCVPINDYELFQYPDYALPLAVKISEVSIENSLDILHVHYAIPHATSAYLSRQLLKEKSPAIITTLHGTDITLVGRDPGYHDIVKFSIEQSDIITAVSNNLKNETIKHFKIKKDINVIYNFFLPQKSILGHKPLRNNYVKEDEKLLVHSSNLRPLKRVEDVIRIFNEVRKEVPSKLLIVGHGLGIANLKKLVAELNINSEVYFVGKTMTVDPYVASGDLFLLPSSHESFGLAALEAMAYGVPTVASNVGGLPELITHGKTGFLAPCGDIKTMAQYAIHLLKDEKQYNQMSQECIKRAAENFCAEKIVPQYEACYNRVMSDE